MKVGNLGNPQKSRNLDAIEIITRTELEILLSLTDEKYQRGFLKSARLLFGEY